MGSKENVATKKYYTKNISQKRELANKCRRERSLKDVGSVSQ